MIKITRILVPTDFSEYGRLAVRYGAAFAEQFDAELHLLHVVDDYFSIAPEAQLMLPDRHQYLQDMQAAAKLDLSKLRASEASQARRVVDSAPVGRPFVEIVRYARDEGADLIVIGSHGRSGLSHVLLGSVAERVVRTAACPVLTVRPDQHRFVMP
jgi:nucleotide-binding universal stress UspA family protein